MRRLVIPCLVFFGCGDSATQTDDEGSSSTGGTSDTSSDTTVATTESTSTSTTDAESSTAEPDTGESGSSSTGPGACELPDDTRISGRVWIDADASDESTYVADYLVGTDEPAEGVNVQLIGSAGSMEATTCHDGQYWFDGVDDGTYLVVPPQSPAGGCARRNCPQRLAAAVQEGSVKMVTIGDSVPVEGDPVRFPARLADLIDPLASVENVNAAVSGSTSTQWLPGGFYWDSNVVANLADADVLVISVGGNDFLNLAASADLTNIAQVLEDAEALVIEVAQNVKTIATEARQTQPELDVVFCLYVDYSQSAIPPWDVVSFLPPQTIPDLIAQARAQIEADDDVIIADLLEASLELQGPLDNLLADPLHFNDAGHQFYAEEIFAAIGGVRLGAAPLGEEHHYSFLAE